MMALPITREDILDFSFKVLVFTSEIEKESKRLAYFAKHAPRCKNPADRVRLSLMAVASGAYIKGCVNELNKIL